MKSGISPKLAVALEADEAEELNRVVLARRPQDLDALVELATAADGVDPNHRRRALYALGRWGDSGVVPSIVRVLPRLDSGAKIAAIDALSNLPTPESLEAIQAFAADPSPQVRKLVVQALAAIPDSRSAATLQGMAQEDPEEWVRSLARSYLEHRAPPRQG
jgi:HEAT repeat protein